MYNHIIKLIDATKEINISYNSAYTQDGKPDIGVRKENGDSVFVDDVFWLIAGDIYNKHTNERISDISRIGWFKPDGLYVDLRAQASIAGKIVQVHLGKREVTAISKIGNSGGTMVLKNV